MVAARIGCAEVSLGGGESSAAPAIGCVQPVHQTPVSPNA